MIKTFKKLVIVFSSFFCCISVNAASFNKYAPKLLQFEGAGYGIHKPVWGDKEFTKTEALTILKKEFWDKYHGNSFVSQEVAEVFIDQLINAGAGKNNVNIKAFEAIIGVPQDGVLSREDVNRANSFYFSDQIVNPYVKYRVYYYSSRSNKKYQSGWIKRAKSFLMHVNDFIFSINEIDVSEELEKSFASFIRNN
jgi:lysozyme family protein